MNYQSELSQANGLARNTGCKIERDPQIFTGAQGFFTVPTMLKLHFNPWFSCACQRCLVPTCNCQWLSFSYMFADNECISLLSAEACKTI